jgi:hypothetical protein
VKPLTYKDAMVLAGKANPGAPMEDIMAAAEKLMATDAARPKAGTTMPGNAQPGATTGAKFLGFE